MKLSDLVIHFDMDGVLADFDRTIQDHLPHLTKSDFKQDGYDCIQKVIDENLQWGLFEYLHPMHDFDDMVGLMDDLRTRGASVRILSACSNKNYNTVRRQKERWLSLHGLVAFPTQFVGLSKEKANEVCRFNPERHILIDDRKVCTLPWAMKGGHAILHDNYINTSSELITLIRGLTSLNWNKEPQYAYV